jgi:uncharacterized membrane protein YkvA (DUF1232 family)
MSTTFWIALYVIVGVALVSALCWAVWRKATAADQQLIKRIARLPLRSKLHLAWALYLDNRVPTRIRLIPPALVLYLALPIDFIPDFIPVLGQLDDVLIVVAGIALLFRFIGRDVLLEHVDTAEEEAEARVLGELD